MLAKLLQKFESKGLKTEKLLSILDSQSKIEENKKRTSEINDMIQALEDEKSKIEQENKKLVENSHNNLDTLFTEKNHIDTSEEVVSGSNSFQEISQEAEDNSHEREDINISISEIKEEEMKKESLSHVIEDTEIKDDDSTNVFEWGEQQAREFKSARIVLPDNLTNKTRKHNTVHEVMRDIDISPQDKTARLLKALNHS